MRTLTLTPVVVTLAVLAACMPAEQDVHFPLLSDVSLRADDAVEIVDRAAALHGALDADQAPRGGRLDVASAPDVFKGQVDAGGLDEIQAGRSNPFAHAAAASAAVAWSQAATARIIGPPAIGIGVVSQGRITQLAPNVWQAVETVPVGAAQVTGTFTVAWVGVGWLAEMRLKSTDGAYNDDVWFTGYLSENGAVGWWDLYEGGAVVGVVEWVADGQGNAQLGLAALAGPHAGSALSWFFHDSGYARVDALDGATGEPAWVARDADGSGEVRLVDLNSGEPACWDADLFNTPCPE